MFDFESMASEASQIAQVSSEGVSIGASHVYMIKVPFVDELMPATPPALPRADTCLQPVYDM